jgi:uncharacterized membrane protein
MSVAKSKDVKVFRWEDNPRLVKELGHIIVFIILVAGASISLSTIKGPIEAFVVIFGASLLLFIIGIIFGPLVAYRTNTRHLVRIRKKR